MPAGADHAAQPAASPTPAVLRCVLLHAPGAALPGDLLTSLSRRIGHIIVTTDAFAAMAEMCAAEQDRARVLGPSGVSGDTPPAAASPAAPLHPTGTVLLLVHPAQIPDAPELVTELRLYAPGSLVWKYDHGANPRLSAVVESDVDRWATGGLSAARASGVSDRLSTATTTRDQQALSSPFTPDSVPRMTPAPSHPPATPRPAPPTAAPAARLRLTTDHAPSPTPAPGAPEIVVRPLNPRPAPRPAPPPPPLTLRGGPADEGPAEPPVRSVLTPEEMRMLLGEDEPGPGSNGHGPRNGRPDRP